MAESAWDHGTLDLHGIFEGAAQKLLLCVKQGKVVHGTRNIRDAGSSFETGFRAFLSERLPAPFSVTAGYLLDEKYRCTPQIDAIIVDGRESYELMRSEGAAYVPYTSGHTLFEIKNSSRSLSAHVNQVRAVAEAVGAMRRDDQTKSPPQSRSYLEAPLTVLVIGNSSSASLAAFQALYRSDTLIPSYTLLLDRGLVIARYEPVSKIIVFNERDGIKKPLALDWYAYRQLGVWGIWEPEDPVGRSGRALLWLYFAIVAQLNLAANGNQGAILGFTKQVSRDFPMVLKSDLQSAKTW